MPDTLFPYATPFRSRAPRFCASFRRTWMSRGSRRSCGRRSAWDRPLSFRFERAASDRWRLPLSHRPFMAFCLEDNAVQDRSADYAALAAHLNPDDPGDGARQIDATIIAYQIGRAHV